MFEKLWLRRLVTIRHVGVTAALAGGLLAGALLNSQAFAQEGAKPLTESSANNAGADAKAGELSEAEIAKLLEQLGHEEFVVREAASAKLLRVGLPAEPGLAKAAASGNREVRVRAQRILTDVRRNDLERRLRLFFNAPIGSKEVTFPAWEAFQKDLGDTRASRRLFASMQVAEGELLDLYAKEESRVLASNLLQQRLEGFQRAVQGGRGLSFPQIVTLYWVATDKNQRLTLEQVSQLMQMAGLQTWDEQHRDEEMTPLSGKLLGRVILRAEGSKRYTALNLSLIYELKEGLVLAEKMIDEYRRMEPVARVDGERLIDLRPAILVIAQLGNRSHMAKLEGLLEDRYELGSTVENGAIGTPNAVRYQMQMRDVALAGILMLAKLPLSDFYDFPAEDPPAKLGQSLFQPRYIGFSSEERRAASIKKWRDMKDKVQATQ